MEIKKKVDEVKEKAKEWYEENKDQIKRDVRAGLYYGIGCLIGAAYGYFWRECQIKDSIGALEDLANNLPEGVSYDVYSFNAINREDRDILEHPCFILASKDDRVKMGLNKIKGVIDE